MEEMLKDRPKPNSDLRKKLAQSLARNPTSLGSDTSGSELDLYSYEKVIGQGSYASVRLATNKKTGKKFAIKIYEKIRLLDPMKMKNVKRETEIMSQIQHPNIIQFVSRLETFRQIHIVMEYIGSLSLLDYCKKKPHGRLEESEAKHIMAQIFKALEYLHSKNISHRDIKMDNVIVESHFPDRPFNPNPLVKLIDFGFSIQTDKWKKLNVYCGTPTYMSPEIISKKDYTGSKADVWAAGVLMFKLVAGVFPFRGASDRELFEKITNGRIEYPPGITNSFRELMSRVLKLNQDERISAKEVLND